MKQVYDRVVKISMNGSEFFKTSFHWHLRYKEMPENAESKVIDDWNIALQVIKEVNLYNCEVVKGIFGREKIKVYSCDCFHDFYYSKMFFKSIQIKIEYQIRDDLDLRTLKNELKAKEFLDFLQDNGIVNSKIIEKI